MSSPRRSVTRMRLPAHELPAHLQAFAQRPGWLETTLVGQLDDRVAGKPDIVQGLANGPEIGAALAHRFRPLAVGLLIAEMEEDDLLSVVVNELHRVDAAPDQPVQVGSQLDIRNPRQCALEVVQIVLDFVGVIVELSTTPWSLQNLMSVRSSSAWASSCASVLGRGE